VRRRRVLVYARVADDLLVERGELRVGGQRHLATQQVEQVRAPLAEVGDPRRHPVSTKLRCRAATPASSARSSWLKRRRRRQSFSSVPSGADR